VRRDIDRPLRESNLKLRLALRAAQIGIWDWALDTGEMQYSPRARTIYGFSPDEPITYEMVRDATHPEDLPYTSALARKALDPKIKAREPYEYRIIRADTGETRWVLAHGEAIFARANGAQKAVRYVGTIQDISERKAAEQALRDGELRQRLAIDAARLAIWELDVATEKVTASPELNRLFGLAPDAEPTIDDLRRLYLPGERERVQAAGQQALAEGRTRFESEFRIRWADGSIHWLLMRAEMLLHPDGSPARVIGVLADIDARKRQEEQQLLFLRELNHRVKNTLSVVQSIAMQTFRDGRAQTSALTAFRERLYALSKANEVLLSQDWRAFSLRNLVEQIVEPYQGAPDRIVVSGEDVSLPPRMNVPLALVLHELCTNAAKYGSLAAENGRVEIIWKRTDAGIDFLWNEKGGRPVASPFSKGFGTRLIADVLAVELGTVEFEPHPEGVRCRILMAV
jgi:PAS domain S-box-containing protein